ncbi:hypothetical protein [Bartonella melophagi]|uniref:Uncharacterized protein n=1 Tax=Bartonella melophagi K-2C TaxID=1094557 RepID=J1JU72_9HYPH|nr:hypothetical protein [Bartonella melophagi]EJF88040.1 hypothetical protein ME3_01312 [Bartonella melophagi K-2C]
MKPKKEWGKMRVVFLANKNLIRNLIEEGYTLKEILKKNPTLNISYHALAFYTRKYFKKESNTEPSPTTIQVKQPTSINPSKTKPISSDFKHDTNKKLEDMI